MNYAIIENGAVANAVVADPNYAQAQGWIELPEAFGIGDRYEDGQFFTEEQEVVQQSTMLTVLQFRRLFTFDEKVEIEQSIASGNYALKVFMDDLSVATEVNLSDPLVMQGVFALEQMQILTAERVEQVLSNTQLEGIDADSDRD